MQTVLLISALASIVLLVFHAGGIYPWSVLLLAIWLTVIVCLDIFLNRANKSEPSGAKPSFYPVVYIGIIAFILITLIPLPKGLSIVTGRLRYEQNCTAAEIVNEAAALGLCKKPTLIFCATRNPPGTMRVLLLILVVYAIFETVRRLSFRNRLIFVNAIVWLGGIVAVLGYLSYTILPQDNRLWWLFSVAKSMHKHSVGCFLNINHYAGFLAVVCIAGLGITVVNLQSKHYLLAVISMVTALVASGFIAVSSSRGALVALVAGLTVQSVMSVAGMKNRGRLVVLPLVGVIVISGVWLGLHNPRVCERVASLRHPFSDPGGSPRFNAWGGAFRLWKSYPVCGVGANALRFGYLQHQNTMYRGYRRFAENEFFQILSEGGLVGIALALLAGLEILKLLIGNLQPRTADDPANVLAAGQADRSMAICSIAVLATAVAHSMFDFILHLPLYAITVAGIVAAGTACKTAPKWHRQAVFLTLAVLIVPAVFLHPLTKYDKDGYVVAASNDELAKLMVLMPLDTMVWRRFAAAVGADKRSAANVLTGKMLRQITVYDPTHSDVWINLGWFYLRNGRKKEADACFKRAKAIRAWVRTPDI